MDFTLHITPAIVIVFAITLITLLIRLSRDIKDIRTHARLSRHLQQLGKKVAQKKITIVIDLRKQALSIIPLLDHIYQYTDVKHEVLVCIRHTAGKNAKKDLDQYRRHNQIKSMRLVSMKAGMAIPDVIKRYTSGALITFLAPEHRLSKDFFSAVSLDFSVDRPDAVQIDQRVRINKTIFSAFAAYNIALGSLLFGKNKIVNLDAFQPGVVYTRSRAINPVQRSTSPQIITSTTAHLIVPSAAHRRAFIGQAIADKQLHFRTFIGLAVFLLVVGLASYMWIALAQEEVSLILAVSAGAYLLTYVGFVWQLTDYSLLDKLNLILLAPFFFICDIILYLVGIVLAIIKIVRIPRINRSTRSS